MNHVNYSHYERRVEHLLDQQKMHLRQDLTLKEFSSLVGVSARKLSKFLLDSYGKSYVHFINSYRIKESKRLIEKSEQANQEILDIAYECGFSSASTFYRAFKASESCTPTQYIHERARSARLSQ